MLKIYTAFLKVYSHISKGLIYPRPFILQIPQKAPGNLTVIFYKCPINAGGYSLILKPR